MEKLAELAAKIGKTFEEGAVVFRQGEYGDTMYIIHQGALAVIREGQGPGTVVARLVRGDVVGEMALVDAGPRSATVKAMEESVLVPVTRDFLLRHTSRNTGFILTIIRSLAERIENVDRMIQRRREATREGAAPGESPVVQEPRSAAFLKSLSSVIDTARALRFGPGDVIFRAGDQGEEMYLVLEGTVRTFRGEEKGGGQGQFGRGHFFGEMALVSGQPRSATAVAATPTVLLPVSREAFLDKIRSDPDVALHTIQILIVRLRRSLGMLA